MVEELHLSKQRIEDKLRSADKDLSKVASENKALSKTVQELYEQLFKVIEINRTLKSSYVKQFKDSADRIKRLKVFHLRSLLPWYWTSLDLIWVGIIVIYLFLLVYFICWCFWLQDCLYSSWKKGDDFPFFLTVLQSKIQFVLDVSTDERVITLLIQIPSKKYSHIQVHIQFQYGTIPPIINMSPIYFEFNCRKFESLLWRVEQSDAHYSGRTFLFHNFNKKKKL